ncbi:hypothetical protein TrVE_jg407 [Triparma verrucosa]|uniref:Vacuolar protein sorting-associated protein n=2 Tax=Triparma TaxID=722752 RepID=A0A9W7AQE6_9STRA|nr:hypothetical protein TrST_g13 [Triparma strigata]GMI05909.1 hypothetical protein TrVE_jg407 [Triparma verrucosa]
MAHRRRGVGVGKKKATKSGNDTSSAAQALAKDLNEGDLEFVKRSLSSLESELTKFATQHADSIKTDPAFRSKFLKMCALLNIDPISSKQTLLGSALGIGDYYYEVAVKAAEVCMATRTKNGGVCSVEEVKRLLRKKGSSMTKVSTDDILLSISKLGVLGGGFRIVTLEKKPYVVSVPTVLSSDHTDVLTVAQSDETGEKGCFSISEIFNVKGWTEERAERAVETLVREGMAWVDEGGAGGKAKPQFWVWSVFFQQDDEDE